MQKTILYFEKPGKENTAATLKAARSSAEQLGIHQVVVASSHGYTAVQANNAFAGLDTRIIAVTLNASFSGSMTGSERGSLQSMGIQVLTSTHTLGDDIGPALGIVAPNAIVRETLYTFSQGMKEAVEVALMAADAGLLNMSEEVISIAGTDRGADTAIVIKPAYTRKFSELRIREILAKPR